MKPFEVDWETEADDQLAEIWTNAVDRDAVTRAANEIDRILQSDPLHAGDASIGRSSKTHVSAAHCHLLG